MAAIFRFFEAVGSEHAAVSTGEIVWSSIIVSEWIYAGTMRCDGNSQGIRLPIRRRSGWSIGGKCVV